MSKGLLVKKRQLAAAAPDEEWLTNLYEAESDVERETDSEPSDDRGRKGSLADKWTFSDPVDDLLARLSAELAARGRGDKVKALQVAFNDHGEWVRVQIRGQGEHRYGYLPAGATHPADVDPTPVERPDSWDF
jgi:hypothetical protein